MAGVASGSGPDRRGSSPGWGLPGGRAAQKLRDRLSAARLRQTIFTRCFVLGQGSGARRGRRCALNVNVGEAGPRAQEPHGNRLMREKKGSSRLGGKKAPLGKSCLDPSRSGKRRGEEPQSQENAPRAEMQRAGIASSHTAASAHLLDQFHNGAASGANVGSIGYRSAGKIRKSFELDGLRRLSGCLDKVNNPHV